MPLVCCQFCQTNSGALLFELQSFALGWLVGSPPLFWALFISFVLGTAYSVNVRAYILMITTYNFRFFFIFVFLCDGFVAYSAVV